MNIATRNVILAPRELGALAYQNGEEYTDCPFGAGELVQHGDWVNGYYQAKEDAQAAVLLRQASNDGYSAHMQGFGQSANPHNEPGTLQHAQYSAWFNGWKIAEQSKG